MGGSPGPVWGPFSNYFGPHFLSFAEKSIIKREQAISLSRGENGFHFEAILSYPCNLFAFIFRYLLDDWSSYVNISSVGGKGANFKQGRLEQFSALFDKFLCGHL